MHSVDVDSSLVDALLCDYAPSMSPDVRSMTSALLCMRAEALGLNLGDYLSKYHALPILTEIPRFGKDGIQGATLFKSEREEAQALIYVAANTDFSTVCHEMFHVFRRQLVGSQKAIMEHAYGVHNGNWTTAQEERAAIDFEKYATTGALTIKETLPVLKKATAWVAKAFRNVLKIKTTRSEVREVFESLFDKDSPLAVEARNLVSNDIEHNKYKDELRQYRLTKKELLSVYYGALDNDDSSLLFKNGLKSVSSVIFNFPSSLRGYTDIHSTAQLPPDMTVFGRGVLDLHSGIVSLGGSSSSHVGLVRGMKDPKRFYYGYSREKESVYIVTKNAMDDSFIHNQKNTVLILSRIFDRHGLHIKAGEKLRSFEHDPSPSNVRSNNISVARVKSRGDICER